MTALPFLGPLVHISASLGHHNPAESKMSLRVGSSPFPQKAKRFERLEKVAQGNGQFKRAVIERRPEITTKVVSRHSFEGVN
jgi:hypothetical protein